ncbi:DUF6082 family protein [Streptomyces sp. NPDC005303]|uniref:DUF6082 family protein n=1 Tax=Streptomyces sp. NPDC005303 TaxID=3155713 RepID=UPI0033BC3C1B
MATHGTRTRRFGLATATCLSALVAAATVLNQQRLAHQSRLMEQHHTNLSRQQRLQWELLSKAMEDPALAAVLDTHEGRYPPEKHRQFLFANALYSHALLAYRISVVTWEELHGYLRITCRNPIFREYWDATRPHRASLLSSSVEARVGRMVDNIIQDLDDADSDEWWVVGEAPTEDDV